MTDDTGWYCYLVRCRDNSLYCGITNRLEERIAKHNSGNGAKYTASRKPVILVYSENHSDTAAAKKRECQIKKLTKRKKEQLVADFASRQIKQILQPTNIQRSLEKTPSLAYTR